jgi:antitoxin (DNA-binding transcriptional repressor) of toxin-antitoxin stability system
MNAVKIADLKNNLSRHLIRVRRGGVLTVLDRETPIARIVPFHQGDAARDATGTDAVDERIAGLARDGVVAPGDPQGLARWLDEHPPVKRPKGAPSAVRALIDLRRESTR